jgi:hypothetical protein
MPPLKPYVTYNNALVETLASSSLIALAVTVLLITRHGWLGVFELSRVHDLVLSVHGEEIEELERNLMHKVGVVLAVLVLGSAGALAQVVGTTDNAASSTRPSGISAQGAPGSVGFIRSVGAMGRQIGTLPRVMTTSTPDAVGQLSIGVSSPSPNLPLVGTSGTRASGIMTTGTYAPGVIAVARR